MVSATRFVCVALLLAAGAVNGSSINSQSRGKVTPIEKVISLLKDLSKKVEEEGKREAAQYDKYACFCKEQASQKLYQIETSKEKIEQLTATIDKLTADIDLLTTEISDLATKISELETEIEDAVTQRNTEHEAYVANATDCDNAISAIERAIEALRDSKLKLKGTEYYDVKTDLAQLRAAAGKVLSNHPNTKAEAVLSQLEKPGRSAGYEYRSNDIIDTLEGLKDKFYEIKKDMDEAEFKLQDAFEKKKLALSNEKKFAEKEKEEKEAISEEKTENKEAAEEEKTQETNDMNADQSFLDVVQADCEKAATLWDQRSQTRSSELTALSEATKILEEKALGSYDANKKLVDLQKHAVTSKKIVAHHTSFLQLQAKNNDRSAAEMQEIAAQKAVKVLQDAATRLNIPELAAAVMKVQVSGDHFIKVRGLIKDLVARLEADAANEATQKSFCDQAMAEATSKRDSANAGVEDCNAQIEQLTSEKEGLVAEIATLTKEIAALQKALLEATELRANEKAENEATIAEANEGKSAVEFALNVLREFYEGQGGEASFLQKYVPPNSDREGKTVGDLAPKIFDSEYKGSQKESGGIIGILEVILSDFQRTITTVTEEENTAQQDFETFKEKTETDISTKEEDVKTKTDRVAEIEDELVGVEENLKDHQSLLEEAKKELEQLKVMCVEGEETYAERVAARKREIEALKEALAILQAWQA